MRRKGERKAMSELINVSANGRVTKDLEVKASTAGNAYLCFYLAVNKGYGENEHPVFLQCWLFGEDVNRMVRAKVAKGSFLHIIGDLDISKVKKDDGTEIMIPKVRVLSWSYVSTGKPKADEAQQDAGTNESGASLEDFEAIDCDAEDPPF